MALSYSPFRSALPILLLHSNGDSIASINLVMIVGFPSFSQEASNISMLMAVKAGRTSLECSRKVMDLRSGFSTTLERMQLQHLVLEEALSKVKKSLLDNIKVLVISPSMREL